MNEHLANYITWGSYISSEFRRHCSFVSKSFFPLSLHLLFVYVWKEQLVLDLPFSKILSVQYSIVILL